MAKTAMGLFHDLPNDGKQRARLKAQQILLGNRLAELRLEAGLTQADLAQRLGVKQAAVSRMEHRADIKVSTLIRYLEGLGGQQTRLLSNIDGKRKRIALAP